MVELVVGLGYFYLFIIGFVFYFILRYKSNQLQKKYDEDKIHTFLHRHGARHSHAGNAYHGTSEGFEPGTGSLGQSPLLPESGS